MAAIGAIGSPRDHCARLDFDTGEGRTRPGTEMGFWHRSLQTLDVKHDYLDSRSGSPMTPVLWSPCVQPAE